MNESIEEPIKNAASECCDGADECIRRNPVGSILFAVGAGLLIGLLVRWLRPEPTMRDRLASALEDLEGRLRESAEPVLRKATSLASDGLHKGEAGAERMIRDATRRVRKLFS